jgi:hypothetical protein
VASTGRAGRKVHRELLLASTWNLLMDLNYAVLLRPMPVGDAGALFVPPAPSRRRFSLHRLLI